ncbi:CDP-glycerol glycerophosphotransferase family protein [Alkalicoccobacillus porphyridii]|uniref:Glycosyltransferase n=1 Tax=Alkalicoccobacillus porphyridii TaxID=2597270 RepID=A0A554A3X3_9BACI|nr:CDP-glycerol glycerophosphotransferase family protein [Alkalicoccobacillus porphyridii]TSB48387.1 glycosyltransferase [Alkalicoccobacillus porphyridii]
MQKKNYLFSIVMPIYNVEEYLKEAIDSIISQTIGFEDNVQLILINDGSPDNSEEICLEYADEYPENVVYIKKENEGVSVARNRGMDLATGEYINFLDPDDTLDLDVLEKVKLFFDEYKNEVDLIAIPIVFFEGKTGNHMLNYKFSHTRVIDVEIEPHLIQMSGASTFFKREDGLGELRLNPGQKFGEDASLMTDIVMKKKRYGVIHDANYNYRFRITGTSALQSSKESYDNYFPIFEQFFMPKLRHYAEVYGEVPKYVQHVIMYDLQWRIRLKEVPEVIKDKMNEYYDAVLAVLHFIDKDVIMKQNFLNWYQKHALCTMKDTNKWFVFGDSYYKTKKRMLIKGKQRVDDLVVIDKQGSIKDKLDGRSAEIDLFEVTDGKLLILGRVGSLLPQDTMKVYIEDSKGGMYQSERFSFPNEDRYMTGSVIYKFYGFKFELPITDIQETSTLKVYLEVENVIHQVSLKFSPSTRLSNKITNSYIVYNNSCMIGYNHKKNRFDIGKYSLSNMLKKERKYRAEMGRKKVKNFKKISRMRIAVRILKMFKKTPINLFMDRIDKADDSAEVLMTYFEQNKNTDKQKNYFVLDKDSADYSRLKDKFKVISYKSNIHKLLFLLADNLISTHCDRFIYQPYTGTDNYFKDLKEYKFVFLQHGITKDDMSHWLKKYDKNFSLFITSSKLEYDSIINGNYGYTSNEIKLTGLPRFDRLIDTSKNDEKIVLVMPTWRQNIVEEFSHSINGRPYSDKFKHSDYFIRWNNFFNDENLHTYLKEQGYKMIFVPHPSIRQQLDDFQLDKVEVAPYEESYSSLMKKGSILVTDFSSVYFDFAYMKKPVFYYHFDQGNWDNENGYFSYGEMGFGEITGSHNTLVTDIINTLEQGANMEEKYLDRVTSFYEYTDQNNSKRAYEEIMGLSNDNN